LSQKSLEKIKLIYEFNNSSPVFARVAESLMKDGEYDEALAVIEEGLKIYPDYVTAKLVLAETLAKKNDYKGLIRIIDEVRDSIDEETVNYYLEKAEEERNLTQEVFGSEEEQSKSIEDDLENLADTISKAKIPPTGDTKQTEQFPNEESTPKGTQFVSETLAEIYLTQQNYKEALSIYEKLLDANPQNAERYNLRIEEIKSAMK
jgi:tetratricopeptide (TPR) repeat protein